MPHTHLQRTAHSPVTAASANRESNGKSCVATVALDVSEVVVGAAVRSARWVGGLCLTALRDRRDAGSPQEPGEIAAVGTRSTLVFLFFGFCCFYYSLG